MKECGSCPIFAGFTLAFALQLRKKHGKTSVRVVEECQLARKSLFPIKWHSFYAFCDIVIGIFLAHCAVSHTNCFCNRPILAA
jgi:hypothetical protein